MSKTGAKSRWVTRVLSILLVVLLCATLGPRARAATTEETSPVEVPSPATTTETEEASTEEVPPATVPASDLKEAKEELLALLTEEELEENKAVIDSADWNSVFCRADVLAAVQTHTQAIQNGQELACVLAALRDQVQKAGTLSEARQADYLRRIDGWLQDCENYPSAELFQSLSDNPEEPLPTERVTEYLSDVAEWTASAEGLSNVLDVLDRMDKSSGQLERVADSLAVDGAQADQGSVPARCVELMQQDQALQAKLDAYFVLDADVQQNLAGDIQQFCAQVDALLEQIALENTAGLDALQNQTDLIGGKMMLVYVALGAGAVGILIGIIAAILALVKRPKIDFSGLASREAAETLDQQNQLLKKQLHQQEQKLNALTQAQRELNDAVARIKAEDRPRPAPQPVSPAQQPVPRKPQPQLPKRISYLKLNYDPIVPSNSFLTKTQEVSNYVLLEDSTVEYTGALKDSMYRPAGLVATGLFYLFDPVLEGQAIDPNRFQSYAGFYQTQSIRRRGKVRQIQGGNYECVEKGAVDLIKM